jgi:hypothetical protein
MGHRAGLYTVRVRKKYARRSEQPRLLGDFDEAGASLAEAFAELLNAGFRAANADGRRTVHCRAVRIEGDDVFAVMGHGESGVAAEITEREGGLPLFHQRPEHVQHVRCGVLFQLPAAQRRGVLAVHVNNGRGVKSLLLAGILNGMRERHDDVSLDVEPFISVPVLDAAIDQDKIERVTLVRYERPEDRAIKATEKWIRTGEIGKLELDITALGRGAKLKNDLLKLFRKNPANRTVRAQIVEFEGLTFDEARVEVETPDKGTKTFNIEKPDAGHPITVELRNVEVDTDGHPTADSLFAALREAAAEAN